MLSAFMLAAVSGIFAAPQLDTLHAPSELHAVPVSAHQINLNWHDNSNNESGFKIERRIDGTINFEPVGQVNANITEFQNTGLAPNTTYIYRVYAFANNAFNSPYSNTANARTFQDTVLITVPAPPSDLNAIAVSSRKISLNWIDHSNNEQGFRIERRKDGEASFQQVETVGPNVHYWLNQELQPNTLYFYRVRAYNQAGNSAYSNIASARTPFDTTNIGGIPNPPTNLENAVISNTQINLNWHDNSNNEQGFKIERRKDGESAFTQVAEVGANVTSYQNMNLMRNTLYFFRVRAFNSNGSSAYSNITSGRTRNDSMVTTIPNRPTDLMSAAVSPNQVVLAWHDNSNNEAGFKIERRVLNGTTYETIGTVGANVITFISSGLTPGTQYNFRVRAFNQAGNSEYSNVTTVTTPIDTAGSNIPHRPTDLRGFPYSNTGIVLHWIDNSDNETGFKVERRGIDDTAFVLIRTLGANIHEMRDSNLVTNNVYVYRVYAYNSFGNSAYSNFAIVRAHIGTNIVSPANGQEGQSLTPLLSWNDVSGTTEYGILFSDAPDFSQPVLDLSGLTGNEFTVFPGVLDIGKTYYWRVYNTDNDGNISWSDMNSFSTSTTTNINNGSTETPGNFRLFNNYPNPFNPATMISYELGIPGDVKLAVYDISGKEVAVLVNTVQNAGLHSVTFDASQFSSGTYFYKLTSGTFSASKKMLLIK